MTKIVEEIQQKISQVSSGVNLYRFGILKRELASLIGLRLVAHEVKRTVLTIVVQATLANMLTEVNDLLVSVERLGVLRGLFMDLFVQMKGDDIIQLHEWDVYSLIIHTRAYFCSNRGINNLIDIRIQLDARKAYICLKAQEVYGV